MGDWNFAQSCVSDMITFILGWWHGFWRSIFGDYNHNVEVEITIQYLLGIPIAFWVNYAKCRKCGKTWEPK